MATIAKIILITLGFTLCVAKDSQICFPPHFMFGVATASFQIEGSWNESGKSESMWDRYTHEHPERIFDHKNADVSDDSYRLYKTDVQLLKDLGVQTYRFSISWSRILPSGLSNYVNEEGVKYYMDLIDELLSNDKIPIVTIYHWDLPQSLQELGGWTNPMMADYYVDYARVLFETYGQKVKLWITFNEPYSFCHEGYGGNDAPGDRASGLEDYMCAHTVLKAHARAYHMYQKEFKPKQNGAIGITLDMAWAEPLTTSEEDKMAAEAALQFTFGWFAHAIFSKEGDYPPIMRKRIDENSRRQNFPRSRLPTFTKEEITYIRGSADYLGYNHYTTYLATPSKGKISPKPSYQADMGVSMSQNPNWPKCNSTWIRIVPWGFRKGINFVKNNYGNPYVIVTENGISLEKGLKDMKRIKYIDSYLRALHTAIVKDKCNVVGYTYWSLMDNFEWTRGYSERFGLYEVDFESANRTRTPRQSAAYFTNVATTGCLPTSITDL